jgi:hypothetical protein
MAFVTGFASAMVVLFVLLLFTHAARDLMSPIAEGALGAHGEPLASTHALDGLGRSGILSMPWPSCFGLPPGVRQSGRSHVHLTSQIEASH